ncbi:transcriptional regulator domain-containing protein [Paraburkholderia sp. MM6662-R1]|uniref:transcriptional regulator domain-containing protein n=1 Tax=Paraburkholderia sp. MM6662-R1 TaxID=2991066 RepID=UPI003D1A2332
MNDPGDLTWEDFVPPFREPRLFASPPATNNLFVSPACIDWKNPEGYPEIDNPDSQRWAWEFLRRSAAYAELFAALPAEGVITKLARQELGYSDRDLFRLRWQVKEPVAPSTDWGDIDVATRHNLIGPSSHVEIFHPTLPDEVRELDREPVLRVTVPATPHQLVVRLSLDGDPHEQGKAVTKLLEDARKPVDLPTQGIVVRGDAMANLVLREGTPGLASFYDRSKPFRLQRANPTLFALEDGSTQIQFAAGVAYPQTVARRPKYLHFVLRTLDAVTQQQNLQREQLEPDRTFFKNTKDLRKWLVRFPFGEAAEDWVAPLSEEIAKMFKNEVASSNYEGDLKIRFTPGNVREWMRYARRCTLEQGYVRLATKPVTAHLKR